MQYYKNRETNEEVAKEDMTDYAMYVLGITIKPVGKNGELTLEQHEFIEHIGEWYFSDPVWTIEKDENDEEYDYALEMADRIYQENVDEKLLEED